MRLKFLIDEDFVNYKKCSMFIGAPTCTFKCDKDCGLAVCQNSSLAKEPILNLSDQDIIKRYLNNPLSKAICFGGLEPLDNFDELINFISQFRIVCEDEIIIYTGYNKEEIQEQIRVLKQFCNIIIKFGRFIPNDKVTYDSILGVNLASSNQYTEKIS